jgi:hypothetical protein
MPRQLNAHLLSDPDNASTLHKRDVAGRDERNQRWAGDQLTKPVPSEQV